MNNNEWIDVSSTLAKVLPVTYNCDYIESIKSNVTSIHLPDWTCNDIDYIIFNFSRFNLLEELIVGDYSFENVELFKIDGLNHLKSIEIGNGCFENVELFSIDGLNELKSLKIGNNSFTKENWYGNNPSRSFHILNCVKLESIEIGRYSFSDYGGGFELKNLPKLSTIKIGRIDYYRDYSYNFWYSSFVIKGIIDDDIDNE